MTSAPSRVRSGPLTVGIGLTALGLSSYLFLALTARALGPARFAGLSSLYVLVYTVGPGLFLSLEQEVARAVASAGARGLASRLMVRQATRVCLVAGIVATVLSAGAAPALGQVLDHDGWLVVGFVASVPAFGAAYLSRGVLAGRGDFGRYSLQLGLEGGLRLAACGGLLVVGVRSPGSFGLLFATATAAAVLMTLPRTGPEGLEEDTEDQPLSRTLVPLTLGAVCSLVLANLAPIIVTVLTPSTERASIGRFLAALVVVRVPLFLFAAVQVTYLPHLAELVGGRRRGAFLASLRTVSGVLLAGTAIITLGAALVGREIVELVFGKEFALQSSDLAVLAAGAGLFAVTTVLAQALVALRHYGNALAGWLAGITSVVLVTLGPGSVIHRAELGFLVGCAVATLAHGLLLLRATAAWTEQPA